MSPSPLCRCRSIDTVALSVYRVFECCLFILICHCRAVNCVSTENRNIMQYEFGGGCDEGRCCAWIQQFQTAMMRTTEAIHMRPMSLSFPLSPSLYLSPTISLALITSTCVFSLASIFHMRAPRHVVRFDETRDDIQLVGPIGCVIEQISHNNHCVIIAMNDDADANDTDDFLIFLSYGSPNLMRRRKLHFTIRSIFSSHVNRMYRTPRRKRCPWKM